MRIHLIPGRCRRLFVPFCVLQAIAQDGPCGLDLQRHGPAMFLRPARRHERRPLPAPVHPTPPSPSTKRRRSNRKRRRRTRRRPRRTAGFEALREHAASCDRATASTSAAGSTRASRWNPDSPAEPLQRPGRLQRPLQRVRAQPALPDHGAGRRRPTAAACDIGGRVDLLYGTDRRFVDGLRAGLRVELGQRFYGLAMPQMYGDIAINDLVIRGGHFLAPCGYESVMAPENFFYSHSLQLPLRPADDALRRRS